MSVQETIVRPRIVEGEMNYAIDSGGVNRFHAKNSALDSFAYDRRIVPITDARTLRDAPRLDREGFQLFDMPTAIEDFRDTARVTAQYPLEMEAFIRALTGADEVAITGPATLRFGERSSAEDRQQHSKTARLIHSDTGRSAAEAFTREANPRPDRTLRRVAHHNIWRTFSAPPQDLPLALCDYRSVSPDDIIKGEAAFDDEQGRVSWTFEAMLFRYSLQHRWHYFADMGRDEILVFKRYDTDASLPWFVPHSAFDDPSAPADSVPRASIEMRTISYWYD